MKKTPFDYGKLLRFLERPMLGGFAELRKVTLSLVMSVCLYPHGTTGLLLAGFP